MPTQLCAFSSSESPSVTPFICRASWILKPLSCGFIPSPSPPHLPSPLHFSSILKVFLCILSSTQSDPIKLSHMSFCGSELSVVSPLQSKSQVHLVVHNALQSVHTRTHAHIHRFQCHCLSLFFLLAHQAPAILFLLFINIPGMCWPQCLCTSSSFCLQTFLQTSTWLLHSFPSDLYSNVTFSVRLELYLSAHMHALISLPGFILFLTLALTLL